MEMYCKGLSCLPTQSSNPNHCSALLLASLTFSYSEDDLPTPNSARAALSGVAAAFFFAILMSNVSTFEKTFEGSKLEKPSHLIN